MWKGLQNSWSPPKVCSETTFYNLKGDGQSSAKKGMVGHLCAFRGCYFSTYLRDHNLEKSGKLLKGLAKNELSDVEFSHGDYTQFSDLTNFVIYCDPPYRSNSHFFNESQKETKFDTEKFIKWCKDMKKKGNLIVISELSGKVLPFREIKVGKESLYIV